MADLSPKQGLAWRLLMDNQHNEVLYGGGAGGGKSWLGALWLMTSALQHQGSRWLMGRAVLKTLKETTLNSFFDVASMHGLRAGEHYDYNGQAGIITIGASQIILKDLFAYPSDPNFDDLGSLEITGAFIDEANQVTSKAKAIVGSRIRYKLDEFGLRPKMLLTCNPARNWVFTEFYEPWRKGMLEPHRAFVPALVTDNQHISAHYIDNLKRLTGPDRERLLLGNWDYDNDPAALMDHDALTDLFTNVVDDGHASITADIARYGSDRTVVLLWHGLAVVDAIVLPRSSVVESAEVIKRLAAEHKVARSRIVVDDDGIGGGVVDLLPGCVAFKGGAKVIGESNYRNLKAQCSYILAERVNARSMAWVVDAWQEEVMAELRWVKRDRVDSDGKLVVLGKDKVKEGLGRSPDLADALMMRMVLELRADPVGSDYLRAKGRQHRRGEFVNHLRNTIR
jgi:hypothetical protein